jgi:two-component system sensor histidine kinase UhpB
VSALAVLCERFSQRTGIQVSQHLDEHLPELGHDEELVVYRVAQEALTNIARHSGADQAELRLSVHDGALVVTVSDDGRGIRGGGEPGTGIRGMRERAALIGATLELGTNDDGRGCAVTLVVAATPAEAPA